MSNDYQVLKRDFDLAVDSCTTNLSFSTLIFRALLKADESNYKKLAEAFPDHAGFVSEYRRPSIASLR